VARQADGRLGGKLLYYHPDATNAAEQEAFVASVVSSCRAATCLFVERWASIRHGRQAPGEARRHASSRRPVG
jgi:hypothetical protein